MGSPPQVRGKLFKGVSLLYVLRITPAGAGKTETLLQQVGERADHPRRCGENMAELCRELHNWGSPPQVRGKLRDKNACIDL